MNRDKFFFVFLVLIRFRKFYQTIVIGNNIYEYNILAMIWDDLVVIIVNNFYLIFAIVKSKMEKKSL